MLRTAYWYTCFGSTILLNYPQISKIEKSRDKISKEEFEMLLFKKIQKWSLGNMKRAGVKVILEGEENVPKDGAVLFVSNHQGNFDTCIQMALIEKPKGFIAKNSLENTLILSRWMKNMNSIFIDRKNPKKSAKAISDGINILKNGGSLIIYPEGTRSRSPEMGEFKGGAFMLATKSKVPIIPVTIEGSYKIMEASKGFIKPATVKMCIHPMIETKNLTKEETKEIPRIVENIIKNKLIEYQKQ